MRTLSRAIFREIAASALLGTLLFTFVLFMQRLGSGKIFEILLRGSAPPATVLWLLVLLVPFALVFAIPMGTLTGVLIGLGRMAGDGEIIAMRAGGVPSRRVVLPVLLYAALAALTAAACSLWLNPLAIQETVRLQNLMLAGQLTAEVRPRLFEEQFTGSNTVLYVRDVKPTPSATSQWRQVFIADLTPATERSRGGREYSDVPRITIAPEAIAVPDPGRNAIQLFMRDARTYDVDKQVAVSYNTIARTAGQLLAARPRSTGTVAPIPAMETGMLVEQARQSIEARVELHQRLALPAASLLLALIGIPLGVSTRRGSKSGAVVITVLLAFLYFLGLISLIGMARQGRLAVEPAVWAPNAAFAALGCILMLSLDRAGDRDPLSKLRGLRERLRAAGGLAAGSLLRGSTLARLPRIPLLMGVVDTYVLSSFLFYFGLLLASFVMLVHVFTFFELLGDIFTRGVAMGRVLTYHLFLTPKLIYDSTPVSVLVAVLVTFGILTKNNEVTAMKASGVSLYRLSVPVIAASLLISGLLFAFDHYYIPECNRIQDGIRNEIKGRPAQTYQRPDRKWVFGQGSRVYYYKYFDPAGSVMVGVNVYELAPDTFDLRRHISAENARWEPGVRAWVFQNGWVRELGGAVGFREFQATTFPELTEQPGYFLQKTKQEMQLNFVELERHIGELRQSGFDTVRLEVQFHRKFSVPLFALIMAMLSVPFSFLAGNRGAMAGVGLSFSIAIAYWAIGRLFEEIGNVSQLPAPVAAWAPDAVFAVAAMYLFTRMRT